MKGKARKYYVVDQVQDGLWYQIGHFTTKASAERFRADVPGRTRVKHTWPTHETSARSPSRGGIYRDVTGIQQDDFVVYRDHRGKFRVDLVTTSRGNHLTIGKTQGEASLTDAIRLAEREAHTRGVGDAVVFALRGNDYVQYGNITHGRFRKGG